MPFDSLGYLNQQTARCAPQKGLPAVLVKEERKKSKEKQHAEFRAAVWARDKGICRATGVPLQKSGLDDNRVGEVDHVINRSTAPDRVYDITNGILIAKRLNRLKKAACPESPEFHLFEISGPDDRGKPQTFIWRDVAGKVTKRRVG